MEFKSKIAKQGSPPSDIHIQHFTFKYRYEELHCTASSLAFLFTHQLKCLENVCGKEKNLPREWSGI